MDNDIINKKNEEIELLKEQNSDLYNTLNTLQLVIKNLQAENESLKLKNVNSISNNDNSMSSNIDVSKYKQYIKKLRKERSDLCYKIKELEYKDTFTNNNLDCRILDYLGIKKNQTENEILSQISEITNTFEKIPIIQNSLENIYELVLNKSLFNFEINSFNDLFKTIDTWKNNLFEYKKLIDHLCNILCINKDELSNIDLIEAIKNLKNNKGLDINLKNTENNDNDKYLNLILKELEIENKNEIIEEITSLKQDNNLIYDFIRLIPEDLNINLDQSLFEVLAECGKKLFIN